MIRRNVFIAKSVHRRSVRLFFLFVLLFLSVPSFAARYSYHNSWNSKRMNSHGLYGRYSRNYNNGNPPHSVAYKFCVNYFAGDIEMPGNILKGYKTSDAYIAGSNNKFSNNIGGNMGLIYTYKPTDHLALRTQFLAGYMRGYCDFYRETKRGNGIFEREFERKFHSWLLDYSIGVEIYPSADAGFFFYAGIGGATSFIKRNFNSYLATANPELNVNDKVTCTVPEIPLGMGYKWITRDDVIVGIELMWHPALVDKVGMNMDGYQSGYIYKGHEYYPVAKNTNKWSDSYMEFGITIGGVFD